MSVDTRGRRAAQDLIRAAKQRGPVPDLDRLRRRRRHRTLGRAGVAVAAVIVLGALAAQALPTLERGAPGPVPPAGAPATTRAWTGVTGMNPHVRDAVGTGDAFASKVAAGDNLVWVLNRMSAGHQDELVRVDAGTDRVTGTAAVGYNADHPVVADDGSVWLARAGRRLDRPELLRIDPRTLKVAATFPLSAATTPWSVAPMVVAGGAVWVSDSDSRLLRVDQGSGAVGEVRADGGPLPVDHLTVAGGWVWGTRGLALYRIDPESGRVNLTISSTDLHGMMPANAPVGGAGGLWLEGSTSDGERLVRLDPVSGQLVAFHTLAARSRTTVPAVAAGDRVIAVHHDGRLLLADTTGSVRVSLNAPIKRGGLAVGAGAVWVTDPTRGRLLRVDPGF